MGLALRNAASPAPGPGIEIELHAPDAAGRETVEGYVAGVFARRHAATLRHFMPWLLDVRHAGRPSAALGMRPARSGPLFLERYLDEPAEQAISRHAHLPVTRDTVIEIGNLAADSPTNGRLLFSLLPALLREAGFRWMIFTATRPVVRLITLPCFAPWELGEADPARLGAEAAQWGRYYDHQPRVMAGDLVTALDCTRHDAWMAPRLAMYEAPVSALARRLRTEGCA